jgi:hypothetical protein
MRDTFFANIRSKCGRHNRNGKDTRVQWDGSHFYLVFKAKDTEIFFQEAIGGGGGWNHGYRLDNNHNRYGETGWPARGRGTGVASTTGLFGGTGWRRPHTAWNGCSRSTRRSRLLLQENPLELSSLERATRQSLPTVHTIRVSDIVASLPQGKKNGQLWPFRSRRSLDHLQ